MKHFLNMLIALGIAFSSQYSIAQIGNESSILRTNTKPSVVRNVQRIPKLKLFRSNPYKYHHIYLDDNDDVLIDDEELMSPYRRQDLFKLVEIDDVSDRVRWRLFLARQLALLKHRAAYN